MGSPGVVEGKQTMKILLVAAFFAVALGAPEPEATPNADPSADPSADPWYGYYGWGGYRGYYGGYYRPYGYYGYYGKRAADAEPLPTPTLLLTRLLTPGTDTTATA